ncbi:hypothetical protein [Pseudonocardia xishanensis]|uniref:Class I poly(R)-hydroxyalkanoic acid synthase n=1 Tax=Pseudonocardia xishanensis TaxID=630995 RepID=A0ABP8RYS3_9PSEU
MTSRADDAALPLDELLVDGSLGSRERLLPVGPAARAAWAALRSPAVAVGRAAGLAADLGRITLGARPAVARGDDPRHADDVWADDPLLSRLLRAHRSARDTALELVDDLASGAGGFDDADADRLRFAVTRLADLLAPGTNPFLQPKALRETAQTGGVSAVRTLRALVEDLRSSPRVPEGRPRTVAGVDTATAPGAVVLRTPRFELIQYLPTTERVDEVPVLVVPGFVNRFHLVDLAPDHSLVRRLVAEGRQVFALSWAPAEGGLEQHAEALAEAVRACTRICRTDRVVLFGLSTGGLLASAVAARIDGVAGLVLAGTTLGRTGPAGRGPVSGDSLVELHALLCPEELVWPAWERRYLDAPGSVDPLRAWNVDVRDVSAALHRDLGRLPELRVLDGPVDPGAVAAEAYVVTGTTDRVGSWQAVYRTTQLLGGKSRFVLVPGSTAAAVGYDTASFRVADSAVSAGNPADAERWRAASSVVRGGWWADLSEWLGDRTGGRVDAPPELGGRGFYALHPAPGTHLQGTTAPR